MLSQTKTLCQAEMKFAILRIVSFYFLTFHFYLSRASNSKQPWHRKADEVVIFLRFKWEYLMQCDRFSFFFASSQFICRNFIYLFSSHCAFNQRINKAKKDIFLFISFHLSFALFHALILVYFKKFYHFN